MRSYLLFRLFTIFTDYRTQMSDKICAKIGIDADVTFALKSSYKKYPFILLGFSFAVTVIAFGLSV